MGCKGLLGYLGGGEGVRREVLTGLKFRRCRRQGGGVTCRASRFN